MTNKNKVLTKSEVGIAANFAYMPHSNTKIKTASKERNRNGYVYLLHAIHDSSVYKIGRSANPNNRLQTFNVKIPFPVEYECIIATYDMYKLESTLHEVFFSKRLNGEWFRLSSEDVEFIKGLAS